MIDRIRTLLTARQLSPTQFADTIGVSRPIISHILSGRNKPSLEVVQKIVIAFPELSLRWLLNGDGPMVTPEAPQTVIEPLRATQKAVATTMPAPSDSAAAEQPEAAPEATAPAPARTDAPPTYQPAPAAAAITPAATAKQAERTEAAVSANGASSIVGQVVTGSVDSATVAGPSAEVSLARTVAGGDKQIRRIVIFYQDGTFTDYQPEAPL